VELQITLKHGVIGTTEKHRQCVHALGLRRRHHTVTRKDCPVIRGLIKKVWYLLEVKEIKK
jgi:large subunit ribosomal protein L30